MLKLEMLRPRLFSVALQLQLKLSSRGKAACSV